MCVAQINRAKVNHDIVSDPRCGHVTVFWHLTGDLKQVGEKDDGLGRPAAVRPEPEQRAGEQPAQAEGGQTQPQEVGRGLQDLQVLPHGGQDDGWGHKSTAGPSPDRAESPLTRPPSTPELRGPPTVLDAAQNEEQSDGGERQIPLLAIIHGAPRVLLLSGCLFPSETLLNQITGDTVSPITAAGLLNHRNLSRRGPRSGLGGGGGGAGPLQTRIQSESGELQAAPHSQPGLRLPGEPERSTFLILFAMEANAPVGGEESVLHSALLLLHQHQPKQNGTETNQDWTREP